MKDAPSSLLPLGGPLAELLSSAPDKLSRAKRTTTWRPFRRAFRRHCGTMQPAAHHLPGLYFFRQLRCRPATTEIRIICGAATNGLPGSRLCRRLSRRPPTPRTVVSGRSREMQKVKIAGRKPALQENGAERVPLGGQFTVSAALRPPAKKGCSKNRVAHAKAQGSARLPPSGTRFSQSGYVTATLRGSGQEAVICNACWSREEVMKGTRLLREAKPHLPDLYSVGSSAAARQAAPAPAWETTLDTGRPAGPKF